MLISLTEPEELNDRDALRSTARAEAIYQQKDRVNGDPIASGWVIRRERINYKLTRFAVNYWPARCCEISVTNTGPRESGNRQKHDLICVEGNGRRALRNPVLK